MTYDDVTYALDGLRRGQELMDFGLSRAIHNALVDMPHAPVTTLLATTSALMGGPSTARIYLINGVFVIALLVMLTRVAFQVRWPIAVGATGIVLASPLGYFCIDQFRPDPAYALALALLVAAFSWLPRRAESATSCGVAGAFLLYLKPSVFAITLIVVATGIGWLLLPLSSPRRPLEERLRSGVRVGIMFVLTAVPFWILVFPDALAYARTNTIGERASVWLEPTALGAVAGSIDAALTVVGWPFWVGLACLPLAIALAMVAKSTATLTRSTIFFVTAVTVLLPIGYSHVKVHFFGLMPLLLFVVGCLVALFDVVEPAWRRRSTFLGLSNGDAAGRRSTTLRRSALALSGVAAVIALAYGAPTLRLTPAGLFPPLDVNGRILSTIIERCTVTAQCHSAYVGLGQLPPILVAGVAEIAPQSMTWESRKEGWQGEVAGLSLFADVPEALAAAQGVDFVVTLGPTAEYVNPRFPLTQIQADLRAALGTSPNWRPVSVPVVGDRYLLFERVTG